MRACAKKDRSLLPLFFIHEQPPQTAATRRSIIENMAPRISMAIRRVLIFPYSFDSHSRSSLTRSSRDYSRP
jgi:hypothetical protein